jgi:L-asparaginase II
LISLWGVFPKAPDAISWQSDYLKRLYLKMNNNTLVNAPVLASLSRGLNSLNDPIIECCHRGLISVVDGDGNTLFEVGDTNTKTHMRSTAKPFQVVPLLENGFPTELSSRDLALFMSSHGGEPLHTERVAEILQIFGLSKNDLRCGAHPPQNQVAQLELLKNNKAPTSLHNNCSGKHTAMLILCQQLGLDRTSYELLDSEIQKKIKAVISLFSEVAESEIDSGMDGCSMPSFCLPFKSIALAYARLRHWSKNPATLYTNQIWQAATTYPEYIAGNDRFDTELMKAAKGDIFSKTGADGMHALSLRPNAQFPSGLGIAIKIVDGDAKQSIRPLVLKTILERLGRWPNEPKLDAFLPHLLNFRGLKIGTMLCHF